MGEALMRYRVILGILIALLLIPALTLSARERFRELFEKEFLIEPWAGERAEKDVCIECHTSNIMKPQFRVIPDEWKMSWHSQNDISCHDCHGGDPRDAAMAMSLQRGFVGTPKYADVPEFCGKCHIGILKNYLDSGHGRALKASRKGPNCVTCHGSHNIQKAGIDIINEQRCTKCHSYERARVMKQALFVVEKRIGDIEGEIKRLKAGGVFAEEEERALFSTQAEFRTLFHTVDVSLVKDRTDDFTKRLNAIETKIQAIFSELGFRKNFSIFLMLVFAGIGVVAFFMSGMYRE